MTKISQTQYPGAGVSRDQRRKNLLVLRDGASGRQATSRWSFAASEVSSLLIARNALW